MGKDENTCHVKQLGAYVKINGEIYDCEFNPEQKSAKAIGPVPNSGFAKPEVEIHAESEKDARKKLEKELGPGRWT